MPGRDSRSDISESPEDKHPVRRRRGDSPSDSDEESYRNRRVRRDDHVDDRRARHYDRRQELAHDDRESRSERQRRDRSPRDDRAHRDRRRSRSRDRSRRQRRSRSPPAKKRRRSYSVSRSPARRSRAPLPDQNVAFHGEPKPGQGGEVAPPDKQKPNYKPTGLLAKEANTVAGTTTVLKYHEPPEARKPPPKQQWRMYVFKGKDLLDTLYIHQRSCWLVGRDQKVTDLYLEHPSISKQHAVLQFRYITSTNEYGDKASKVKPYLIDLESANGTMLNGKKVEASRFVELVDNDFIKFGDSEREYVLMLPPSEG